MCRWIHKHISTVGTQVGACASEIRLCLMVSNRSASDTSAFVLPHELQRRRPTRCRLGDRVARIGCKGAIVQVEACQGGAIRDHAAKRPSAPVAYPRLGEVYVAQRAVGCERTHEIDGAVGAHLRAANACKRMDMHADTAKAVKVVGEGLAEGESQRETKGETKGEGAVYRGMGAAASHDMKVGENVVCGSSPATFWKFQVKE